jgi:hypothetical protein
VKWPAVYDQVLILISKRFCHRCESLVLLVRDKLKCLQSVIIDFTSHSNNTMDFPQGCLISKGILKLVKLQTKGIKITLLISWTENLNNLFTFMGAAGASLPSRQPKQLPWLIFETISNSLSGEKGPKHDLIWKNLLIRFFFFFLLTNYHAIPGGVVISY